MAEQRDNRARPTSPGDSRNRTTPERSAVAEPARLVLPIMTNSAVSPSLATFCRRTTTLRGVALEGIGLELATPDDRAGQIELPGGRDHAFYR